MNLDSIILRINKLKEMGKKIVLVTGVFDILHIEHIRFLKKAKREGDVLIVGIESDGRVSQIKGEGRPVNLQDTRLEQMKAIKYVDEVFVLPQAFDSQEQWESLIKDMSPDVYAVSSHTSWIENKKKIANKFGSRLVVVHDHNPSYSTTKLFNNLCSEL